ncbi:MAG: hypothetical protein WC455_17175 [Dehalococcoidia bacterium]|jgi:hypothetical protein
MIKDGVLICDACGERPAVGVAGVPMVPMSGAYCLTCLQTNNHPMYVLIANTICCDGLENCRKEWVDMVLCSLGAQRKTLDWFNAEVQKGIDDFNKAIKESEEPLYGS